MEMIKNGFMKEYGYNEDVFKIEIDKNVFLLDGKYWNSIKENELELIQTFDEETLYKLKTILKNFSLFMKKYIDDDYKMLFSLCIQVSDAKRKLYKQMLNNCESNFKKVNRIWQITE
jgi:hypothetical protein